MPMYTFFEAHDFTGKTIIPFCSHEGSGLGRVVEATPVKILSGCYTGEQAIFQKDGEKLSLIGSNFIIKDILGIGIEIEE